MSLDHRRSTDTKTRNAHLDNRLRIQKDSLSQVVERLSRNSDREQNFVMKELEKMKAVRSGHSSPRNAKLCKLSPLRGNPSEGESRADFTPSPKRGRDREDCQLSPDYKLESPRFNRASKSGSTIMTNSSRSPRIGNRRARSRDVSPDYRQRSLPFLVTKDWSTTNMTAEYTGTLPEIVSQEDGLPALETVFKAEYKQTKRDLLMCAQFMQDSADLQSKFTANKRYIASSKSDGAGYEPLPATLMEPVKIVHSKENCRSFESLVNGIRETRTRHLSNPSPRTN